MSILGDLSKLEFLTMAMNSSAVGNGDREQLGAKMKRKARWQLSIGSVLAVLLIPCAALADRIDGNWCAKDGRVMTIDGPSIITPGGNAIAGDYKRHSFVYTVPDGEFGAGAIVNMHQLNHETIRVSLIDAEGSEIWNRCDVTS